MTNESRLYGHMAVPSDGARAGEQKEAEYIDYSCLFRHGGESATSSTVLDAEACASPRDWA